MGREGKKLIALALAAVLAVGSPNTAEAAPHSLDASISVDYKHFIYETMSVYGTEEIAGITYDVSENTITLKNYNAPDACLHFRAMGNDLKLKIVGENKIKAIDSYALGPKSGGGLRICGNGSLTFTDTYTGIRMSDLATGARLFVEKGVTLRFAGEGDASERIRFINSSLAEGGIVFEGKEAENNKVTCSREAEDRPKEHAAYSIGGSEEEILKDRPGQIKAYRCNVNENAPFEPEEDTEYWLVYITDYATNKYFYRLATLNTYPTGLEKVPEIYVAKLCRDKNGDLIGFDPDAEETKLSFPWPNASYHNFQEFSELGYDLVTETRTVQDGSGQEREEEVAVQKNVYEFIQRNIYETTYQCYSLAGDTENTYLVDEGYNDKIYKLKTFDDGFEIAVPHENGLHEIPAKYTQLFVPTYQWSYCDVVHVHAYEDRWSFDANGHYKACSAGDGAKSNAAAHTWQEIIDDPATPWSKGYKHEECTVCGYRKGSVEIPMLNADNTDPGTNGVFTVKEPGKVIDGKVVGAEVSYKKPAEVDKNIVIPDTVTLNGVSYKVTSVEKNAFKGDKKIEKVTIGKNVTVINADAFSDCENLKSVTVGVNVKTIGSGAFANNAKLTTVKLGANVTTVGNNAFLGCTALKKIVVPDKVKTVGDYAFSCCTKMTQITVGKNVRSIGADAFSGNKKLKTVTIKSSKIKSFGRNAFKGLPKKATIKVPASKYKAYKKKLTPKTGFKKTMKLKKI